MGKGAGTRRLPAVAGTHAEVLMSAEDTLCVAAIVGHIHALLSEPQKDEPFREQLAGIHNMLALGEAIFTRTIEGAQWRELIQRTLGVIDTTFGRWAFGRMARHILTVGTSWHPLVSGNDEGIIDLQLRLAALEAVLQPPGDGSDPTSTFLVELPADLRPPEDPFAPAQARYVRVLRAEFAPHHIFLPFHSKIYAARRRSADIRVFDLHKNDVVLPIFADVAKHTKYCGRCRDQGECDDRRLIAVIKDHGVDLHTPIGTTELGPYERTMQERYDQHDAARAPFRTKGGWRRR